MVQIVRQYPMIKSKCSEIEQNIIDISLAFCQCCQLFSTLPLWNERQGTIFDIVPFGTTFVNGWYHGLAAKTYTSGKSRLDTWLSKKALFWLIYYLTTWTDLEALICLYLFYQENLHFFLLQICYYRKQVLVYFFY